MQGQTLAGTVRVRRKLVSLTKTTGPGIDRYMILNGHEVSQKPTHALPFIDMSVTFQTLGKRLK